MGSNRHGRDDVVGAVQRVGGLHEEGGVTALDYVRPERQRRGIEDELLLRTAAVLPFHPPPSLAGAAGQFFGEPAILLRLGWPPLQIRIGDNERQRSPLGPQPGWWRLAGPGERSS